MDTLVTHYIPSTGSNVTFKNRLLSNQFGDGYRQTLKDGLNATVRSWSISWNALPIADAAAIEAFLTSHAGQPFYYTLPRETVARKWDCDTWTRAYPSGGYDSVTCTFVERFDSF